jgi:dephospho-CoA kinase
MIIGLIGYAQSGKDTVANMLVDKFDFERRAFADRIREILYEMNPMVGGEPLQMKVDA